MSWSISMSLLLQCLYKWQCQGRYWDILVEIGVNDNICKHSFILKSLTTHQAQFQESCSD